MAVKAVSTDRKISLPGESCVFGSTCSKVKVIKASLHSTAPLIDHCQNCFGNSWRGKCLLLLLLLLPPFLPLLITGRPAFIDISKRCKFNSTQSLKLTEKQWMSMTTTKPVIITWRISLTQTNKANSLPFAQLLFHSIKAKQWIVWE